MMVRLRIALGGESDPPPRKTHASDGLRIWVFVTIAGWLILALVILGWILLAP